ncbi:MAG: hypothetical protein JXA99_17055 [Candidatus Lokiarchaeota archaeon]|nr:hypothetical protein [Candidatus Lokiarchaeota archaeon]
MDLKDFKKELPKIFENVKKDVEKIYGKHRAGLSLGLAEMGISRDDFIGGMHFYPGTDIIMNKTPLRLILKEQSHKISWAYAYHILLHEYIHSLGIIDEYQCRMLTKHITKKIFKEENHPAIILSEKGIGAYIPNFNLIYNSIGLNRNDLNIEYIYGFDENSYTYYS